MKEISMLFVCLGNICRSPMAESVFANFTTSHRVKFNVDSCGTASYHIGDKPDRRALQVLQENGIKPSHRGRQINNDDFEKYDYVLCMDNSNKEDLDDWYANYLKHSGKKRCHVGLFGDFIKFAKEDFKGNEFKVDQALFKVKYDQMEISVGNKSHSWKSSKVFDPVIRDPYYDGIDEFYLVYYKCLLSTYGLLKHIDDSHKRSEL